MLTLLAYLAVDQVPEPSIYERLGTASIVAVILSTGCWVLWRALQTERATTAALRQGEVLRERELADRLVPLLTEAVKVLSTAPERFDQALSQVQNATSATRTESLLTRLESVVGHIAQERGPSP